MNSTLQDNTTLTASQSLNPITILRDAWKLIRGNKWTIWSWLLFSILTLMGIGLVFEIFLSIIDVIGFALYPDFIGVVKTLKTHYALSVFFRISVYTIGFLAIAPFVGRLYAAIINICRGNNNAQSLKFSSFKAAFDLTIAKLVSAIVAGMFLSCILLLIGAVIIIWANVSGHISKIPLPILITVAIIIGLFYLLIMPWFMLSLQLVVDNKTSGWRACFKSIRSIAPYYWPALGLVSLLSLGILVLSVLMIILWQLLAMAALPTALLVIVDTIPLIFCLIWAAPWILLANCLFYTRLIDRVKA